MGWLAGYELLDGLWVEGSLHGAHVACEEVAKEFFVGFGIDGKEEGA